MAHLAGVLREAIESPIGLEGLQFTITPSLGIALYPGHGTGGPALVAHADAAMYRAKQRHSRIECFEPSMSVSQAPRQAPR